MSSLIDRMHLQLLARSQQLDKIEETLEKMRDEAIKLRSRADHPDDEDPTHSAPKRRKVEEDGKWVLANQAPMPTMVNPAPPAPEQPAPVHESPLLSPPDSPFYTPASPHFSPDSPIYQDWGARNVTPFNPPDILYQSPFGGNATVYRSFSPDTGSENANDNHRYTPMGNPSGNSHYYYPRSAPGPGAGPDRYAGLGSHLAPGPGAGRDDDRLHRIYRPIGSARPKAGARASHVDTSAGAATGNTYTNAVSSAAIVVGNGASGRASDPIDIRSPVEIDEHFARTMRAGHTPGPKLAPINLGNQDQGQEEDRLAPFVFGVNGPVVYQQHQEQPRPAPFIFGGNIPAGHNQEQEQEQDQARPVPFDFVVRAQRARTGQADRLQHEKEMMILRFRHERKLAIEKQQHERMLARERQDHELRRLEAVSKILFNEHDQPEP